MNDNFTRAIETAIKSELGKRRVKFLPLQVLRKIAKDATEAFKRNPRRATPPINPFQFEQPPKLATTKLLQELIAF